MILKKALVQQRKSLVLTLLKQTPKFALSLHQNGDENYLYVNKTEICKFKVCGNILWYQFCLGSISKDFTKDEMGEIYLNSTVYEFSVDHSSIQKKKIYLIFTNI